MGVSSEAFGAGERVMDSTAGVIFPLQAFHAQQPLPDIYY